MNAYSRVSGVPTAFNCPGDAATGRDGGGVGGPSAGRGHPRAWVTVRRPQERGGHRARATPPRREKAVFTTLPAKVATPAQVLECYRLRWQIELTFKGLKSIAQLGHVPKSDDRSSRAWLYGKLLVALLTQKLARIGRSISPGATTLSNKPPVRSRWREFRFAFQKVAEAVTPSIPLAGVLARWNEIASALGERSRTKRPQLSQLPEVVQ